MTITVTEKRINSVGIDVGTSTSHLIFSELILKKDPMSRTEKFYVAERKIKYRGEIFFTPLEDNNKIDVEALTEILINEYERAGVKNTEIDTGAVIITGESAKKENAERIIEKIALETGKFVAASAGPNFESVISAYGSGAVKISNKKSIKLIHTDIGGGTSNIAVIKNGLIIATACINVGGRLIAFDENNIIIRLEPAGKLALSHCGLNLSLGDIISEKEKQSVAKILAKSLLEVVLGQDLSDLTKKLMMTANLPSDSFEDYYSLSFSGGVGEYIYEISNKEYNDLGLLLGKEIKNKTSEKIIEVPEKIRATVIGASEYTLQVSGSTTFISPKFSNEDLPIRNLPIVVPNIDRNLLSEDYVSQQIKKALERLDIIEGENPIAIAFKDPVRTVYEKLTTFSKGLIKALPKSLANNTPIILIFDSDIGNSVGNVLFRETGIKNDVLSIDEIELKEGDFIDIGKPIVENRVFPVIVKSLIFG